MVLGRETLRPAFGTAWTPNSPMTTAGLIPHRRLRWIPENRRLAHEYCYFLHDQCVHALKEYEEGRAHHITIKFRDDVEARKFSEASGTDSISLLLECGYVGEARRVVVNTITMAMVSDCLHHLFEALSCLERRKFVVAFNLLRKPLMDNLVYLSWILGDEDDFYAAFSSGSPEELTPRKVGNRRHDIIAQALAATEVRHFMEARSLQDAIFNSQNEYGLYGLFQHAVHLVTVDRPAIRTAPENFNFIFKNPLCVDVYDGLYDQLPEIFLYLCHVIMELFHRMKPMNKGAKSAFNIRSIFGFHLVALGDEAEGVLRTLSQALTPNVICPGCATPLMVTPHNAARVVLSESFRCTKCRRVHGFPFSWVF